MTVNARWFRVPEWVDLTSADEQLAQTSRAVVTLLRHWHLGADPSERQMRALTGFGAGRSIRLFWSTLAWAKESGAAFPDRLLSVSGPKLNHDRTTGGPRSDHSDKGTTPDSDNNRTTSGPRADHERTTSRARALLERRERSEGTDAREAAPVPDEPREEAPTPLSPAVETPAPVAAPVAVEPIPAVLSARVTPPPMPAIEDTPLTVDGVELPRDLPALLSGIHPGFMHYVRMLLPAGAENTERLLRVARDDWRFMGHGLNAAKVNALDEHLARTWGVKLGALAKERPKEKAPALFGAPRMERAPSVDRIDQLFGPRSETTPTAKEVNRAE